MTIDAEVWVSGDDSVEPVLKSVSPRWIRGDGEWAFERAGWQLLVYEPEEANPSDAPTDLEPSIGDRSFRITLTVEPSEAPAEAQKLLRQAIRSLVDELDGVALDPMTGDVVGR